MHESDIEDTIVRYNDRFQKFGYSPKSLGWGKGKQNIRFDILTSLYDFTDKTVLDIGCDLCDFLLEEAKKALEVNFHAWRFFRYDD